jgi:hypothetical protein
MMKNNFAGSKSFLIRFADLDRARSPPDAFLSIARSIHHVGAPLTDLWIAPRKMTSSMWAGEEEVNLEQILAIEPPTTMRRSLIWTVRCSP